MGRHTADPNIVDLCKREVNFHCPLCGSLPLILAHTIKEYKEVGQNYDYLLAICGECEGKVENKEIPRTKLHEIK